MLAPDPGFPDTGIVMAQRPKKPNQNPRPQQESHKGSGRRQNAHKSVYRSVDEQPDRRELKYYGVAACQALWRKRPEDVIRIYVTEENLKTFSPLLKWAAVQRKAYHVVNDDDLQRLTESTHHQGICLLALEPPMVGFNQLKKYLATGRQPQMLVYLDGVENPHNFGAIVRTCAHFGFQFILGEQGKMPRLSPSACRVAEGGAESVAPVYISNRDRALEDLRQLGFKLITTAARGESLYRYRFPERVLLVMGAEVTGVSQAMIKRADTVLAIPGSGHVESLNVSVAFAVLAGEYARQVPLPADA